MAGRVLLFFALCTTQAGALTTVRDTGNLAMAASDEIWPFDAPQKIFEKMKLSSQKKDFKPDIKGVDLDSCPKMPTTPEEWEKSYLWAVFIDGKDAEKGPHVYDWDHEFFYKVSGVLSKIFVDEGTAKGKQDLSVELIEEFREGAWGSTHYDTSEMKGGSGIMPHCTDRMHCEDRLALLQNIPTYLYTMKEGSEDCPKHLRPHVDGEKPELLRRIVETYNDELAEARGNGGKKRDYLNALVAFSRSFAFLHPFQNGNGRLRNILLQREIRRLGIGCATMMYNYNKDAFVDGWPRYLKKVTEGIKAFEEGAASQSNPWLNKAKVDAHFKKFETMHGLAECAEKDMGSGGSISLLEVIREGKSGKDIALGDAGDEREHTFFLREFF